VFWTIVLTVPIVAAGIGWHHYVYKHYHYICSNCGQEFVPKTFANSIFGLNNGEMRKLRCTKCGSHSWARAVKNA